MEVVSQSTSATPIVLRVQQAMTEPANFLKLLITKSATFERLRRACSGSAILLAVVDSLADQISVAWAKQRVRELTAWASVLMRVAKLAFRIARRRLPKPEMRCFALRLNSDDKRGELIVAWLLLANRDHPNDVRNASRRDVSRWFSSSRKDKVDQNDPKEDLTDSVAPHSGLDGSLAVVRFRPDPRQWPSIAGMSPSDELCAPWKVTVTHESRRVLVRILPLPGVVDNEGKTLMDLSKIRRDRLETMLRGDLEKETFPSGLTLEFTVDARADEADQVQRTLESLANKVRKLAAALKERQPRVVSLANAGMTTFRTLSARLTSLIPAEYAYVEAEVEAFLETASESEENFCVLLAGEPGTGKTSGVLHLAAKLGLNVTKHSLLSLCALKYPVTAGKSLILVEEFETQFKQLVEGNLPANNLSNLYNHLDGSSCLQGCVFVFTANSLPEWMRRDYYPLFRTGRVDHIVTFTSRLSTETIERALNEGLPQDFAPIATKHFSQSKDVTPSDVVSIVRGIKRAMKRPNANAEEVVADVFRHHLEDAAQRGQKSVDSSDSPAAASVASVRSPA